MAYVHYFSLLGFIFPSAVSHLTCRFGAKIASPKNVVSGSLRRLRRRAGRPPGGRTRER
jgi:hypothetical protein